MANDTVETKTPISLPKGGGAIKGIGETFQPNLFSGVGNFSVPIFTSPGRNGFGPQLTVQYSSGNGNGPFGLGWQLSIPRVTRKTEKGLPSYIDQDVFVMSGAEDLVPHLVRASDDPERWEPVVTEQGEFSISLYRPRTEGQFTRIERWMASNGDVHWRATTKENITSIYGRSRTARIIDPLHPDHVFEWLLEETFDSKGNHILYEYVQENAALQLAGIHEHNRSYTQAYIRRILYGNTPENIGADLKVGPARTATDHANPLQTRERHYLFEVLFDYGDLPESLSIPTDFAQEPEDEIPDIWPVREDPFSSFRAGFEIRTLRRCRRVLMLHHFKEGELEGAPLVKSTDFQFTVNADTQLSFLTSTTVSGYRKDPNDSQQYLKRDMPPVVFKYSEFESRKQRYQSVTAKGHDLPPRSLGAPDFAVMDVFGNGLPDILQDTGGGLHYWQNLGQGQLDRRRPQSGNQPVHSFAEPKVSVGDMGGDGLADLVVDAPPTSGFYESTPDGRWKRFRRFEIMPSFDLSDPNTRLVDLTGDGLSDVLITRDHHFLWFRCSGESGYDEPRSIPRKHDLELFPDVYFDDPAGRVRLADMTGDGLSDIALVHDGRIDYWPNLGYGRFGQRVTMSNTPRIGFNFDPRRLFLADLDGTGSADLVYVDQGEVHFWFNQSGNAWSDQQTINGTPNISDLTAIQFIDFYGTGTMTLLWSHDFGQHSSGSNYKILDFCGGKKPNLLVEMDNSMGATTRVQYAPSTKFYLEGKTNGTPWNTSLPFPVQVVEKTEVIDHISKTKLVTTYKYHHGYYDGREREFRGFGRVDQFDTEFFDDFSGSSLHGDGITFDNNKLGFHVPPVETRTWFHTGVHFDTDRYLDHRKLTEQYRSEYYQGDPEAFLLDEHVFVQPDSNRGVGDTPHEAHRALRGAVLHTEVYGRDESVKADHPYVVTENRYQVKALQPKDGNNHAVFHATPKENISYHYERTPEDPRISQSITLGIDDFGNVTDSVSIGYPRRVVPDELPEQGETKIVYTHNDFINQYSPPTATVPAFYYAGISFQTRDYEVTGIDWQPGQPHMEESLFESILDTSPDVDTNTFKPYEWQRGETDSSVQRRIIEWTRNYFRTDAEPDHIDSIGNLDHRLLLGEIESLALPYEVYQAAFTFSLLQDIYEGRTAGIDLPGEGGYHPHPDHATSEGEGGIEDYLWIPSGRQGFAPEKFFQGDRAQDPFGNISPTESDAYALLIETARDALPAPQTNVMAAKNDYRVLQAFEVTDPNGNRNQVAFDALGLVVGTAVMGEDAQGNHLGDSLTGFVTDLSKTTRDQHIEDPLNLDSANNTNPHNILKSASTRLVYDLNRFLETGEPNVVYTLARETHVSDEQGTPSKIQHAFIYSDGFGRKSQTIVRATPDRATPANPRWVGTGTTVFNNKGKAVQQYEPFFSDNNHHAIEQHGVSPTTFYDPLERIICTVHPNHTFEKVLFDPWQLTTWDSNDTVLLDPRIDPDIIQYVNDYFLQDDRHYQDQHGKPPQTWYQEHILSNDVVKQTAATKTESHANTPTIAYLDSLGRPFLTLADNGLDGEGNEQKYRTRIFLDIEGNRHEEVDALNRSVIRYNHDMLNNPIHQVSMEAGERWMLNDVAGNPIRAWDSRGYQFSTSYDLLRRPSESFVSEGVNPAQLVQRTVYGETRPNPAAKNFRRQIIQVFDQAGVVTIDEYDFKGNVLSSQRQFAQEYKATLDWSDTIPLETEIYSSSTRYNAHNRPMEVTAPDSSVTRSHYNDANLLESVTANLKGMAETSSFVTNIDYDAKGQRRYIQYGNDVNTEYEYEPLTFRLLHRLTKRNSENFPSDCPQPPSTSSPGCDVQNLHYTYDAIGNIIHIRDDAQQAIYFRNQRVEPSNGYSYDPVYQLIEATGREHLGQLGNSPIPHSHDDATRVGLLQPGDSDAMGTYIERYVYDDVGNFLEMRHRGNDQTSPGWTRSYIYNEDSQLEPSKKSNRLSNTSIGNGAQITEHYEYDTHGNVLHMAHMPLIQWNYLDQLQATAKQVVNSNSVPETTYYVYDTSGQRVRKVTERKSTFGESPTRMKERIYLGGFEIFRVYENDGNTVKLERETLHIMDDRQQIALVETRTQGSDGSAAQLIRFQFSNHLGSASLELDDQAQIISYEEYTPYGNTSYQAGRTQTEVQQKRYRFTGMERDEENGLNYHSARYYAPWLGRWVSTDPIGVEGGLNLYSYVQNRPVITVDPMGAQPATLPDDSNTPQFNPLITVDSSGNTTLGGASPNAGQKDELLNNPIPIDAGVPDIKDAGHFTTESLNGPIGPGESSDYGPNIPEWVDHTEFRIGGRLGGVLKLISGIGVAVGGCLSTLGFGCWAAAAVGAGIAGAGLNQVFTGEDTRNPLEEGASKALQFGGVNEQTADLITQSIEGGYTLAVGVHSVRPYANGRYLTISNGNRLGTFKDDPVYAQGQQTRSATSAEIARYDLGMKQGGIEIGLVKYRNGKTPSLIAGDKNSVHIPGGPNVKTTSHTHPNSPAIFSGDDARLYLTGRYAPDVIHTVTGPKWPITNAYLSSINLAPEPALVTTAIQQSALNSGAARPFEFWGWLAKNFSL